MLSGSKLKAIASTPNPVAFKVLLYGCTTEAIDCELKAVAIVLKAQRIKSEQKPVNLHDKSIKLIGLAINLMPKCHALKNASKTFRNMLASLKISKLY